MHTDAQECTRMRMGKNNTTFGKKQHHTHKKRRQQQCGRSGSVAVAADVWRRQPGIAPAWQYQYGSVIAVAGQRKCGIVSVQAADGPRRAPPTCATARRGRPDEAYPKGRPHPQAPKGGAGATPRHTALRRG